MNVETIEKHTGLEFVRAGRVTVATWSGWSFTIDGRMVAARSLTWDQNRPDRLLFSMRQIKKLMEEICHS